MDGGLISADVFDIALHHLQNTKRPSIFWESGVSVSLQCCREILNVA